MAPAIILLFSYQALAATSQPEGLHQITPAEVQASLESHAPAWAEKVTTLGRPRLLLDKEGLKKLRQRFPAEQDSPEMKALVKSAAEINARSLPEYFTPEQNVQRKGITLFDAKGELWMREVGNDIVALTIAAALEQSPELQKKLHDLVMRACSYPTWGQQAAAPENMDLACAHVSRGIALAWDWFPNMWTEEDRALITKVIGERVGRLLAGLYGQAFWSRAYEDNHNHVDCCALAWCGIAFYNDIPQAPEWLAAARLAYQNVAKYYPEDGSSTEGVPYWSYGMSFILQYIEGTRHVIDSADLYQGAFLKNAAAFRLNSSTSGLEATLPWGDAPSRDFYGPHHILQRLAGVYNDTSAQWLAREIPWAPQGGADVMALNALWRSDVKGKPELPLDHHSLGTDTAVTRSGWGGGDYLLTIKSGFTNRNHSHLDAGALALAFGGEWLLTTPGYGKGSGEARFWDRTGGRWTYFSNSTESHCTLVINGKNQRSDLKARGTIEGFFSSPSWMFADVDLSKAYRGENQVRREVLHRRAGYILVRDTVNSLAKPPENLTAEWLAQLPTRPTIDGETLEVNAESGRLRLTMLSPAEPFSPRKPTSPRVDVDPSALHTFSVSASGPAVHFLALLQPIFGRGATSELTAEICEQTGSFTHLRIKTLDSTDHVFFGEDTENFKLPLSATDQSVSAAASTLAVSLSGDTMTSCVAVEATSFQSPEIQIAVEKPVTLGLQRLPDGSWLVDATRDVAEFLQARDFQLHRLASGPNEAHYLLAKSEDSAKLARAYLDSLVVFRERAPLTVKALAPQPPMPTSIVIPIEAEDFTSQAHGRAEAIDGKPGARNRSLRGTGNGSPTHLVTWDFIVPEDGQYTLTIRYATDLADLSAAFLIDGAAPDKALTKVNLPFTGGWSIQEDNWRDYVIPGADSKPFIFHLAKGKHSVSLTKPSGAIALDWLEFRGVTGE